MTLGKKADSRNAPTIIALMLLAVHNYLDEDSDTQAWQDDTDMGGQFGEKSKYRVG